jgi:hypothetical protein
MFAGNINGELNMNKSVTKGRPGRPPSPVDQVRSNRIVTFVTDREMLEMTRLAESENLSMSAVCHQLIRESLRRAKRP